MLALLFFRVTNFRAFSMRRPDVAVGPGDDLGRHLEVRRLILGHQRQQAARVVGVDSKTWSSWETGVREPFVHQYPAILWYLEYEPWPPPACLGEALLAERRRKGLSVARAASSIDVDEGTWRRWERGEWRVKRVCVDKLSQLLGQPIEKRFPAAVRGGQRE